MIIRLKYCWGNRPSTFDIKYRILTRQACHDPGRALAGRPEMVVCNRTADNIPMYEITEMEYNDRWELLKVELSG